jgi:hypothetical protein
MVGECFIYDTPPNGSHLFVVVAPSETTGFYLAVNVTTNRPGADQTCILEKDAHPFLTEDESVVFYAGAREFPEALIRRYQNGQPCVGDDVLRKIQDGALSVQSRLKKRLQKLITKHLGL